MLAPVRFTGLLLAISALCGLCRADVLLLKNGGRIQGTLVNPDQSPRTTYEMQSGGARISVKLDQVEEFIAASDAERRYEILLKKMPDSARGNWKLAEWCREKGLREQREFHLEEVIRLDPAHKEARRDLGFSWLDGEWTFKPDFMKQRGFVLHEGKWKLPQDKEIADSRRQWDLAVKGWNKKIKLWRGWMGKKHPQRAVEGEANIRSIDDPIAAESISQALSREQVPAVRQMYVRVLGRLHTQTSTKTLIRIVVGNSADELRQLALDQLEVYGRDLAIDAFIKVLQSKENLVVRRAGVGLGRLSDERAIRPLITALVTEHKIVLSSGGSGQQITTSFGGSSNGVGTGGLGFGAGGGPKLKIQKQTNREVLDALIPLAKGADFRYNQFLWRQWYIDRSTPNALNLRRAP